MDNEANKRWILNTDNQDVLAQINAVLVTVEPEGGSAKPTGKPFLEAYLHSLSPNYPREIAAALRSAIANLDGGELSTGDERYGWAHPVPT
jgi:hypothetical protein